MLVDELFLKRKVYLESVACTEHITWYYILIHPRSPYSALCQQPFNPEK